MIDIRQFAETPRASKELMACVKALRSQKLLQACVVPRMSVDFLLLDNGTDLLHVLYTPPLRAYNSATNTMQEAVLVPAQVGGNTARMEHETQPRTGWTVDMIKQTCPCAYHFKCACCVHHATARTQQRGRRRSADEPPCSQA